MERSAIVQETGLLLTRAERNLVTQLPGGESECYDDLYSRRMKALGAAADATSLLTADV